MGERAVHYGQTYPPAVEPLIQHGHKGLIRRPEGTHRDRVDVLASGRDPPHIKVYPRRQPALPVPVGRNRGAVGEAGARADGPDTRPTEYCDLVPATAVDR